MIQFNRNDYFKTFRLMRDIDVKDYIYPFPNESTQKFIDRKNQSFFINHFKSLFQSLVIPLFSENPIRETENKLFELFLEDVDRQGTSMNKFMYDILIKYKVQGNGFIIFNNYEDIDKYTQEEIIDKRLFPWITSKDVYELYDIQYNKEGDIKKIEFYNGKETILSIDGMYKEIDIIIGFTKNEIYTRTNERDSKRLKSFKNEFGFIPVIMLNNKINKSPESLNLADLTASISNQFSEQRALERKCAFAFLQVPEDNPDEEPLEIGADGVLYIPSDSSKDAKYISPDPNILKVLIENAEKSISIFKQEADRQGAITISHNSKSGFAYEMEFLAKDFVLKNLSLFAEEIERKIFDLFVSITGTYAKDYNIRYNKEFKRGNKNLLEKISIVEQSKRIGIEFTKDELENLKKDILNTL
ncbi:MAG: hypothetical protein K9L56_14985 [Clostridiales bacterium]|nr:hypothetical protein [Clostridiales bacterium]